MISNHSNDAQPHHVHAATAIIQQQQQERGAVGCELAVKVVEDGGGEREWNAEQNVMLMTMGSLLQRDLPEHQQQQQQGRASERASEWLEPANAGPTMEISSQ